MMDRQREHTPVRAALPYQLGANLSKRQSTAGKITDKPGPTLGILMPSISFSSNHQNNLRLSHTAPSLSL